MKKKSFTFLKVLFIVLLLILLLCAGMVFYVYQKINDISRYQDKFVYDYQQEILSHEGHEFKDCIFYDRDQMVFEYEVPAYYLYEIINEDSMKEILSLPEELSIAKVGIEPLFGEKKVNIYLSIRFRNVINTCLKIVTDLTLSEDKKEVQLRFDDFYVIDEKVTEYARQNVELEKGSILFRHRFPVHVPYYRMPDYRPDYIFDLSFKDDTIFAKYDIAGAMREYLEETSYHEDSFETCMEKIDLEVRMNGIAH